MALINNTMSSSASPIDITNKSILTSISGGYQNPAISGFVIRDQNNIQKCNTNLQNCSNIKQSVNNAKVAGKNPSNGHIYICIDGTMHRFNGSNLNNLGIQCDVTDWDFFADESGLYAKDPNGNVRKLSHNGNSWTTIYNGGDITSLRNSTKNYILANTSAGGLKAIKKDGTSNIQIVDPGDYIGVLLSIGTKLFYDLYTSSRIFRSCIWTEGASQPTCKDNAYIAGTVLAPNGKLPFVIYKILEVRNVTISQGQVNNGALYSLDPYNNNSINLGQLPQNITLMTMGIGRFTLLDGYDYDYNKRDIFFADVDKQNSLKRLTNTPDKDEWSVF